MCFRCDLLITILMCTLSKKKKVQLISTSRRNGTCDGTTIVRTHEIVAMVPRCLCHPGNHFQVPVRRRESPQSQKTHQWTLNHWTRQHHRHLVFTCLFTPFSLESCPNDFPCRIRTMKYYLVMKRTSRPYGMDALLGDD